MTDLISEAVADPNTVTDPAAYDALLSRIRHEEPVRWMTPAGHRPFWLLAKHADISEVSRQPEIFLNEPRTELITIVEEERVAEATGGRNQMMRTMLHMDGLEHRSYRSLTQGWFTPANLKRLDEGLTRLAKEFVDRLETHGGSCDFMGDMAAWYPLRVIMMILGVPPEEEPEILRLTRNFVGRKDPNVVGEAPSEVLTMKAVQEIFDYFTAVYHDRLKSNRDDLATVIAMAKFGGKPIELLEALSYYLLIATAGHETTSATIAGGMLALIENPGEMDRLRANAELLSPAIDEMLRWVTPTKHFFRTAAKDYQLRGKLVHTGDSLMLCYPSGNRDEEIFEDPFAFRIDRTPNKHLSFGFGAHLCLGQHLAKMEIRALFKELIKRLAHVELSGQPSWVATNFAGGLRSLPISFEMRS